jgi:hypothetical protein
MGFNQQTMGFRVGLGLAAVGQKLWWGGAEIKHARWWKGERYLTNRDCDFPDFKLKTHKKTTKLGSLTNKRFRMDQHDMDFKQTYLKICHQRHPKTMFWSQQNQGNMSNLQPHRDWREWVKEKSTGKQLFYHALQYHSVWCIAVQRSVYAIWGGG